MHFRDLEKTFPKMLDTGVSIELISAPGRGKSEFIAGQIEKNAERTGQEWGFATMFLATQTPVDLLGYMVPSKDEKGRLVSDFTSPPWMRTVDGRRVEDFERGILFLDEYGQGESDVKRASAELLLNRQIGPHRLPKGWSVVAASNRANDRSGVTKNFDFVINRRLEIHISDDIASWEKWAWSNDINPLFIHFATQNPQIVFAEGVPDKQGPWCTPRSLVMCSKLLTMLGDGPDKLPTDHMAIEMASGLIGEGAAAQLMATVRLAYEMPAYDDIVSKPKTTRVPEKPDAMMLIVFQLASRVQEQDLGNVIDYIERLPQEFTFMFAKSAIARDPDLVNNQAFGAWCVRNSALVNAIASF